MTYNNITFNLTVKIYNLLIKARPNGYWGLIASDYRIAKAGDNYFIEYCKDGAIDPFEGDWTSFYHLDIETICNITRAYLPDRAYSLSVRFFSLDPENGLLSKYQSKYDEVLTDLLEELETHFKTNITL